MARKTNKIQFYTDLNLSNKETQLLVEKLAGFLATCRLTTESDAYLKYNESFQKVLDKL
jgi:hypothetical protein